MKIQECGFSSDKDLRAMEALAREFRPNNLHVTDLPYRFSSWALDDPENVHLWSNETGGLLAWAVLRLPLDSLDLACHPEAEGLRRLQAYGTKKIVVETDNWRNTAFQLYESLGFRVIRDVLVYRKDH